MRAFEPERERAFQSSRHKRRALQTYWAGLTALVAYNALLVANFVSDQIEPAAVASVLVWTQTLVTAPCIALLLASRRCPAPRVRDAMKLATYALVVLGAVLVNRSMSEPLLDAFMLVLIPVVCNVALPLSFVSAAVGSVFAVAVFVVNVVTSAKFAPEAQGALALVYIAATAITLVANYRYELAERMHYLSSLREAQRSEEVQRANAALATLSRTDFLTGLANRRHIDERFGEAVRDCRAENRPLAVLLADIDHFKAYNDRFGHLQGDDCLREVAQAIAGIVEAHGGFVGRFGGEEFVAVFSSSGFDSASAIGDRIRGAVLALAKPHAESAKSPFVTLSVGVATLNPDWPEDAQSLLRRADAALYRAKRNGRDRTELDLRAVGG